jgi:hypothetical protein
MFRAQTQLSLNSASIAEQDDDTESGPDTQTNQTPKLKWALPYTLKKKVLHTHLEQDAEERMTVKHHISMMALLNLAFSRCITQRLYHTACSGD